MNKHDIGKLKRRMEVTVNGEKGVVCSMHEPEWRDHKTGAQCKEFQGALVRVNGRVAYYHAENIAL